VSVSLLFARYPNTLKTKLRRAFVIVTMPVAVLAWLLVSLLAQLHSPSCRWIIVCDFLVVRE
jgi:hypothetical protein